MNHVQATSFATLDLFGGWGDWHQLQGKDPLASPWKLRGNVESSSCPEDAELSRGIEFPLLLFHRCLFANASKTCQTYYELLLRVVVAPNNRIENHTRKKIVL
jgi:hypothetical protein